MSFRFCVDTSFSIITFEQVSDGLGSPDSTVWAALDGDWSKGAVAINTDIADDYDQCNADPSTNLFEVTYYCGSGSNTLTVITEPAGDKNQPCIFVMKVDSSLVCASGGGGNTKKGISGGWIFVIIVVVVLSVYFLGGILFMRFKHGKSGAEMIPNIAFWRDLPTLIKDGCGNVVTKCKSLCGVRSVETSSSYGSM